MLKIIHVAICLLNVLMFVELRIMVAREIKENEMERIESVSLVEKIVAIMKFIIFAFTPILNLTIFFAELVSLYTEYGREEFLDKALENYA